jgi:hypothetical protein
LVLVPAVEAAPGSLKSRLIVSYRLLKRATKGTINRLHRKRIVHLLHIGKTGGTAVKCALNGHEHAGAYELVLHEHNFGMTQTPLGEKVVFMVRDPLSRFVSGFYGRQRQDQPRHHAPWTPGEAVAFQRFSTPNELALALSSDDEPRRAEAVEAMQSINHIRSPHWAWFKNESYFLSRSSDIVFIGFQETLDEDFMLLKQVLGLPEEIRLPQDEVAAHKNPAHLDKHLDEEAVRNLKIWYGSDYRFLSLCKEIAARIHGRIEQSSDDCIISKSATIPAETLRTP